MWIFKRLISTAVFIGLLLCSTRSYSNDKDWALKFGPNLNMTSLHSESFDSSQSPGFGFHSQVAFKWTEWEISMRSYAFLSNLNKVQLEANDSVIQGKFHLRRVSFGPVLKYTTGLKIRPLWPLQIFAGPLLALQSFKTKNVQVEGGSYQPHQKITMETQGFLLGIGSEEQASFKKFQHYYELTYQYLRGEKASVVGGTHTIVTTLSTEKAKKKLTEHTFLFSFGIVIF